MTKRTERQQMVPMMSRYKSFPEGKELFYMPMQYLSWDFLPYSFQCKEDQFMQCSTPSSEYSNTILCFCCILGVRCKRRWCDMWCTSSITVYSIVACISPHVWYNYLVPVAPFWRAYHIRRICTCARWPVMIQHTAAVQVQTTGTVVPGTVVYR